MSSSLNIRLASEYNEFLFAPICDEPSGLKLSVLSALARQNIDPWQEAAALARLSSGAAKARLAGAIVTAVGGVNNADAMAAALVDLLPRATPIAAPATDLAARLRAMGGSPRGDFAAMRRKDVVVMILVMAGLTLGMNYFMSQPKADHEPPAASLIHKPVSPK
jgi:hypothetical protein